MFLSHALEKAFLSIERRLVREIDPENPQRRTPRGLQGLLSLLNLAAMSFLALHASFLHYLCDLAGPGTPERDCEALQEVFPNGK